MSGPPTIATGPRARIELPHGDVVAEPERVRVSLALGPDARKQAVAILAQLRRDGADHFCMPAKIDDSCGLTLEYPVEPTSLEFCSALPHWRSSLAVHLPELIAMATYLETCMQALAGLETSIALAPMFLRYWPAGQTVSRRRFRWLAVPVVDATLADWSRASCESWLWTRGDVLLGRPASHAGAYSIGAALYLALVGELFPVRSAAERFRRALRGQIAAPGAVGEAARAALPGSFSAEAEALDALVASLLSPEPPSKWHEQLARLAEQLHPYRTAVRWEYEGQIDIARQILERFAATAPESQVPWEVLVRLRERDGDETGALSAALQTLGDGDGDGVRSLVVQMRRIARGIAPGDPGAAGVRRDWLARAIAELDKLGDQIGDLDRIHIAHIEARYLGRCDGARLRLAHPADDRWDEILRRTILARLHAGAAEWLLVAKLCKDTRLAIRAMPVSGGGLGSYLIAYLDYLDGVAHFAAVGLYSDASYLPDAFERFIAALDSARGICAPDDPLIDAAIDWLGSIEALGNQLELAAARALANGIDAYLAAHGIARRGTGRTVPALVWYDEDRLLALSEAS